MNFKWMMPLGLTIATLSQSAYASSALEEEAGQRLQVTQAYSDPSQAIPLELRTIFDPTAKQKEEKPGLGAGILRVFHVAGENYVIYGIRFGLSAKLSVGGAVEATDKTIQDAIVRELTEEYFGQLPLSRVNYADQKTIAGGFQLKETGIISKGWGPYLTFFALESGYTLDQLQNALNIMNANASLHFPVAEFFRTLDKANPEPDQVSAQANALLQAFNKAQKQVGIVPLKKDARDMLVNLVAQPTNLPAEGGFEFAKKYVHDYTEYSEFHLVPFSQYMGMQIKKFGENEAVALAYKLLNNK